MNILIVIVHYWNPDGGGSHQSLRPNPAPRIHALEQQLLHLRRLGNCQSFLHLADRAVYRTNDFFRNNISIKIVTDGEHHVLDRIAPEFHNCFDHVVVSSSDPKFLGFEAHTVLGDYLCDDFDIFGYVEDDLIISDPSFFLKLEWFTKTFGSHTLLLPHRFESSPVPHIVDRLYIDGALGVDDLLVAIPEPSADISITWSNMSVPFESPHNPHAGCFFLTAEQLKYWLGQPWWNDRDVSFISPLESAATLGISKTFHLYKSSMSHASWLEIEHYGDSFHSLISTPYA